MRVRVDCQVWAASALLTVSACEANTEANMRQPTTDAVVSVRASDNSDRNAMSAVPAPGASAAVPVSGGAGAAAPSVSLPRAGMSAVPPPAASMPAMPPPAASVSDPECVVLRSCCSTLLDAPKKTLCQAIVEQQTESLCKVASADYCAPVMPPSADACVALNTCCATLEDDQEDCQEVADAKVAADCRTSLSELCPEVTTTTTPATGACAMLDSMCCSTLEDDEDIEECQAAVSGGDQAACQEALDALCGSESDDD